MVFRFDKMLFIGPNPIEIFDETCIYLVFLNRIRQRIQFSWMWESTGGFLWNYCRGDAAELTGT